MFLFVTSDALAATEHPHPLRVFNRRVVVSVGSFSKDTRSERHFRGLTLPSRGFSVCHSTTFLFDDADDLPFEGGDNKTALAVDSDAFFKLLGKVRLRDTSAFHYLGTSQ